MPSLLGTKFVIGRFQLNYYVVISIFLRCCRYLESEFPNQKFKTVVYHIPKVFLREGERQGCLAEELVFQRLKNLCTLEIPSMWIIFFHNASYGGYSNRNQRLGKLMIREHDFVVFVKHEGKRMKESWFFTFSIF